MKKNIVIGVTGGIAAYKMLDVTSRLKKMDYEINVILTKNACEFVKPLPFETLSHNYVVTDTFNREQPWEVEHISLAKKADIMLIAPATANVIGKIANGIADDMLTTTVMAARCPVVIAPAMNTAMYENPIVQENIRYLKEKGYIFIEPDCGMLACGDVGAGKLPSPEQIAACVEEILLNTRTKKDFLGKHVLVTAGPTVEAIDPVRFITNHSSGKMGYAVAENAARRGAEVVLISGPTNLACPKGVKRIDTVSAVDMYNAVHNYFEWADLVVKVAAVADYRPKVQSDQKVKKQNSDLVIELVPNPDILKSLGEEKTHQVLVGFAAETQNVVEYAKQKIENKNLDFIVANNITQKGAGFKGETNAATLIDKEGNIEAYDLMKKSDLGNIILDKAKTYFK